jgi:hypothetical protein
VVVTDIYEDFKSQRFIISQYDFDYVIFTDLSWAAKYHQDIKNWCDSRNAKVVGMTVEFPDKNTLLEFILRWA